MRASTRDVWLASAAAALLVAGVTVSVQRTLRTPAVPAASTGSDPRSPAATSSTWTRRSLAPVANPDPAAAPQPRRIRPYHVAATADGAKAYVTLAGKEIAPGSEVAVLDPRTRAEVRRIRVGSHPLGLALHPSGRWLVVTNRYSNFLSIVDVATDTVVSEIPAPFYCEDLVFSPGGDRAYVSNFWLNQVLIVDLRVDAGVLTGRLHELGFDRRAFFGAASHEAGSWRVCPVCGWRDRTARRCPRCGHAPMTSLAESERGRGADGVMTILRARCGTSSCHLYAAGGFGAGPDDEAVLASAVAHATPGRPDLSPLVGFTLAVAHGGWADALDGRHHPGGVVFDDPDRDPDLAAIRDWIARGVEGPGIAVGDKPRDLVVSPDGATLYVANTGSLDVSVVDLRALRETRRIFTRSPVNDLAWANGRLVLATLGVGSGHPKAHDEGRESLDPDGPDTEFTLRRNPSTGLPLPLDRQSPLGAFDDVDGTAQQKFRDITNDVVVLDPSVEDVAAYRAEPGFTRYTSDSFEALAGDVKGDVPPALMKVVGAFPEQIAQAGDRLYVTMSGTFQVQEWRVDLAAAPDRRLVPGRVFATGFKPTGLAVAGGVLIVANHLAESVSFIDLATGASTERSLSRLPERFPATEFELGEFFVQTSVISIDQDQSCVHCHYRDTSDGKPWSVSQVMGQSRAADERSGGSRVVPDIRNLVQKVPFFVEGTLSMNEPLTMMMEQNPLVDFQGRTPAGDFDGVRVPAADQARYAKSADALVVASGKQWTRADVRLVDLMYRRDRHVARLSERYFGRAYAFRDFQRFIAAYQGGEPRLLPNPEDPDDPRVRHGRAIFESARAGCSQCHPAPAFTDKQTPRNQNRAFRPLVSARPRDGAHTLVSASRIDAINGYVRPWDVDDRGRVEEREGAFVAPSLRGIWARPPSFLHHGRAIGLREVLATPGHAALGPLASRRPDAERPDGHERGFNETNTLPDTHGATSHLSAWDLECLVKYLRSIE